MLGFVKMSALSAVLSVGVVASYSHDTDPAGRATTGKLYHDRVLPEGQQAVAVDSVVLATSVSPEVDRRHKGDRLTIASRDGCSARGGAPVAVACVSGGTDRASSKRPRVVTAEVREASATSVFTAIVPSDSARR